MNRVLLSAAVACAAALTACSDAPSNPDLFDNKHIEKQTLGMDGHWLYNPGACEGIIKTAGIYDLKIENARIHVGDIGQAWVGRYRESSMAHEKLSSLVAKKQEGCAPFEFNLADYEIVDFDGRHAQMTLAFDGDSLLIVNDGELQWLTSFDMAKLQRMEIEEGEVELPEPESSAGEGAE
jgi:hypothetical protein